MNNNNLIVVDFDPRTTTRWNDLAKSLELYTGKKWEFYGKHMKNESFRSIWRYFHYFKISWELFLRRNSINNVLSIQQFYGLILAFYCNIFFVKKRQRIVVLSFIYRTKTGIKGIIYKNLINFIISSKYIDCLVVHSEYEVDYYSKIFKIDKKKFKFCLLGVTDDSVDYKIKQRDDLKDKFVLSAGNSNRDFEFLENSLKGMPYLVKLFSHELHNGIVENIIYSDSVPVPEYYKNLAECYCVVIALKDPNISSGQLVILQSYAFGKPVIITSTKGCKDYIRDDCAVIIKKNEKELKRAVEKLIENDEYYNKLSEQARKVFEEEFSLSAMGKRLASIFNEINSMGGVRNEN